MLCLVVENGGRRTRHVVDRDELRIGRAPDNDVVVDSSFVSWHHARLLRKGEGVEIEDLGSHNGTFVAGSRVARQRLTPPATFQLGSSVCVTLAEAETDDSTLSGAGEPMETARAAAAATELTDDRAGDAVIAELGARILAGLAGCRDSTSALQCVLRETLAAFGVRDGVVVRLPDDADAGSGAGVVLAWAGDPPVLGGAPLAEIRQGARAGLTRMIVEAPARGGWLHVALADRTLALVFATRNRRARGLEVVRDALGAALVVGTPSRSRDVAAAPEARCFTLSVVGPAMVDGDSAVVRQLHASLRGTLTSDLPVLLRGETGTGKEVYARAVHLLSPRSGHPFGTVNASAIPEDLLESMLFGVEEGAATGVRRQAGLLREADGGTFFFDEIGEMSLALQAKLLRVLDRREVQPVGGRGPVAVDVRFVAATNRDLADAVGSGRFRKDLYYRLCGHEVTLPSLREHADDVPLLVHAILDDESTRRGRPVPGITVKAMRALVAHDWPGNVRELESTLRRLVHDVVSGEPIRWVDLPEPVRRARGGGIGTLDGQVERFERDVARRVLAENAGNLSRTAKSLGIGRNRLRALLSRGSGRRDSPEEGREEA